MITILPFLFAIVISAWAFLSLVGGERTRCVNEREAAAAAEAAAKPATRSYAAPAANKQSLGGAVLAAVKTSNIPTKQNSAVTPPAAKPAHK